MDGIFEVEGMTLLSWTTRIAARDEAEACELAQRLGQRTQAPASAVKVDTLGHRVAGCQPSTARAGAEMAGRFQVEGTTLVTWTQLVETGSEEEASRLACQGFAALGVLGHEVTVDDTRHRVVGCRRLESFAPLPGQRDAAGERRARARQTIRHSL
jgi:hypothetical protein